MYKTNMFIYSFAYLFTALAKQNTKQKNPHLYKAQTTVKQVQFCIKKSEVSTYPFLTRNLGGSGDSTTAALPHLVLRDE